MTRAGRVLAVSFDGILQPLGYSQVARVGMALAASGVPYAIASLERASDLADTRRVARVRALLERSDVPWETGEFCEGGGAAAIGRNIARLTVAAAALARRTRAHLLHARAVPGGIVAQTLRRTLRVPFVFDARSYWVDEQVDAARRFRSPVSYAIAKRLERDLFADAEAIVTLTELQAQDVRAGLLGARASRRPVIVIPTIADYDEFRLREAGVPRPDGLLRFAGNAPTIAIVGAMNRSYDEIATAKFARAALEVSGDLMLLVLSAQASEHQRVLEDAGVSRSRTLITAVPHDEIAQWMAHIDWGILFLRETFAKRASMPTKLAEFFATGVRPIQHGCNPEVSQWVRTAGSGIVLPSLAPEDCGLAAHQMPTWTRDRASVHAARERTREHFSLASAAQRYRDVLSMEK